MKCSSAEVLQKIGRRQGRAKEEPLKDSQRGEGRICLYMSESCLILHFSG